MGFRQQHLNSAEESRVEALRYQEQVQAAEAQQANKIETLCGYYAIQHAFRADVPVVFPSQVTPFSGLEAQVTDKHGAAPRTTKHPALSRAWLKEQMARMKLSKVPTQPLQEEDLPIDQRKTRPLSEVQETWYSLKPLIMEWIDTKKEIPVVKPRLTLKQKRGA